jgi:Xaa-Pro dipeptidase
MSTHEPSSASNPDRRQTLVGAALLGAGAWGCAAAQTSRDSDAAAAGAELFADLADQRPFHAPISAPERAARRARLGKLLASRGLDAFVCEGGATMTYLAGVSWGKSERAFTLVVLSDGSHFWICPAFEAEKARLSIQGEGKPGGDVVTWDEHEYAWKPFAAALRARRVERVAVDPALRVFIADELASEHGRDKVVLGRAEVIALRASKDAHELALLRRANELTQQAIVAASRHIRVGMTGAEAGRLITSAQQKLGLTDVWRLSLVGAAAAYPHGDNSAVVLKRGDFLLVDTGGSFHGYQSDNTRTWCVEGQPSGEQLRAWNAVRDAQLRAFEAVRPGVPCGAIDRAARASLKASGYGEGYEHLTHRLGHGIGLEGHEDPYFDGGSEVVLAPGMTLSDEPGVYVYGSFGVRLEDIVAVTDSGADHFGSWQRDCLSPA